MSTNFRGKKILSTINKNLLLLKIISFVINIIEYDVFIVKINKH